MQHRRHLGREHVVVAQLQLGDGHRVVFIYYGHRPAREQHLKRRKGVVIAPPVAEVVPCEQQLRRNVAVLVQAARVFLHQQPLANRGAGLLCRSRLGPLVIAQQRVARGYGRARHHDDLVPLVPELRHLSRQRAQPLRREPPALLRQGAGAYLYDYRLFPAHVQSSSPKIQSFGKLIFYYNTAPCIIQAY